MKVTGSKKGKRERTTVEGIQKEKKKRRSSRTVKGDIQLRGGEKEMEKSLESVRSRKLLQRRELRLAAVERFAGGKRAAELKHKEGCD